MLSALIAAHVTFTTAGYVGLIATNFIVLILCRSSEPAVVLQAVRAWRGSARVFGPLLGIGVLLGLWLAGLTHVGLLSLWLVITYALIVLALGAQAALMIPWQSRAQNAAAAGKSISTRPIVVVLAVFTIAYLSIILLMLLQPG